MKVRLTPHQKKIFSKKIKGSGYQGSDEVVREVLSEHQARRQGSEVVMTPELERLLDEGLKNLDQAKTTDELRRS